MQELLMLNKMATNFLDRTEYATFLDLITKIKDRAETFALPEEYDAKESTIKYSYDIEMETSYKIFRNNHKGERIELEKYLPPNITLFKIPLGKEPKDKIKQINESILSLKNEI